MRTALVTGSSGFLGRHFVRELTRRGYRVIRCDIADQNCRNVVELARANQVVYDLVVHCAARSPHRKAIDTQPVSMIYNQMLDATVFEWATRSRPKHLLYLSSSAVYPVELQSGLVPYRLEELDTLPGIPSGRGLFGQHVDMEPDASYGKIKQTGERMAREALYAGINVHVVRPFSGYGEDQSTDYPFGRFAEQVNGHADTLPTGVRIWGSGNQVRDWIHVEDVVSGALAVVDANVIEPINLCTGVGTTMADVVMRMAEVKGYCPRLEFVPGPEGVPYRVGDPTRMLKIYTPRITLDQGIERAITGRLNDGPR